MADNLSNTAENLIMDWINGVGTPTRPTTPLQVALVTVAGSDSTAGTEVDGGSYARQDLSIAAAVGGAASNSADLEWTAMPAVTLVGWEIWDSAGSAVRLWWGPLSEPKALDAGDDFKISAGDLTWSIS